LIGCTEWIEPACISHCDDLRLEPTIYLLPESDTEDEALQLLAEVSREIFEEQLNAWHRVPSV
jgi:hypothetical protein